MPAVGGGQQEKKDQGSNRKGGLGLRKWETLKGNWGEGVGKAVGGGEERAEGRLCNAGRGVGPDRVGKDWGTGGLLERGEGR